VEFAPRAIAKAVWGAVWGAAWAGNCAVVSPRKDRAANLIKRIEPFAIIKPLTMLYLNYCFYLGDS
jgi:hypothetical protein